MKTIRISKYLVLSIILLGLLASVFYPTQNGLASSKLLNAKAVVIADQLNLRKGPGFDQPVLLVLLKGQELIVLDHSLYGIWSQVRLSDGTEGWVFSLYIQSTSDVNSFALVDKLNLRAGPGLSYQIIRELAQGQVFSVLGRNLYSDWLVVLLPDGTGGWVYSPFIYTNADITSLPISEAYGGPSGSEAGQPASLPLLVTIRDNQAEVNVAGFPSHKVIIVSLGTPGNHSDITLGKGKTDNNGNTNLSFQMPNKWSNGELVTEQDLILTVSTEDGSFTREVKILYLRW